MLPGLAHLDHMLLLGQLRQLLSSSLGLHSVYGCRGRVLFKAALQSLKAKLAPVPHSQQAYGQLQVASCQLVLHAAAVEEAWGL